MEDLLQVGVITTPHGIQGEVKVFPTTDDPARYTKLKHVILDTGTEKKKLEIASVKFFKQFVIVKFQGIDHREDAEKYMKKNIYVTREDAVELKEGEYFIADLIGLTVRTDEGETLGVLTDVIKTGANDVYAVRRENGKEILIPVIRQCIRQVDIEGGTILVHLLSGLLELNQKKERTAARKKRPRRGGKGAEPQGSAGGAEAAEQRGYAGGMKGAE